MNDHNDAITLNIINPTIVQYHRINRVVKCNINGQIEMLVTRRIYGI